MFCINCGKEINDRAKFCPHCGSKNEPINNDAEKKTDKTEPTEPKVSNDTPANVLPNINESYNNVIPKQTNDTNSAGSYIPKQENNYQAQADYGNQKGQSKQSPAPQAYNRYNQETDNAYQENNVARRNNRGQASQKSSNRGLKTIFFMLLGLGVLLAVFSSIMLLSDSDFSTDISAIIEAQPIVGDEVRSDWSKGEYSINNIGGKSPSGTMNKYTGVWQLKGIKTNIDDSAFTTVYDKDDIKGYLVIDTNTGKIHSVVMDSQETVLQHREVYYEEYNDELYSEGGEDIPDEARLKYIVNGNVLSAAGAMGEGIVVTDWAIYEKTHYDIDYMLNLAAAIQETETIDQSDTVQDNLYEIEQQILGAWEANLENMGEYYGCVFGSDGTFRYMEIKDGETVTDTVYIYDIISPNQMILEGNDDVVFDIYIEYNRQEGHNELYISSDTEIMVLAPVDALNPPNPDASDSAAQGESVDIVNFIEGKTWVSTGNEYDNDYAVEAAEGYPRTYDLEYGELVYNISNGVITTTGGTTTEYFVYEGNELIKAFSRNVSIEGKEREMYSVFFTEDGYLYEIEMMDDSQVSNIIELEVYEP